MAAASGTRASIKKLRDLPEWISRHPDLRRIAQREWAWEMYSRHRPLVAHKLKAAIQSEIDRPTRHTLQTDIRCVGQKLVVPGKKGRRAESFDFHRVQWNRLDTDTNDKHDDDDNNKWLLTVDVEGRVCKKESGSIFRDKPCQPVDWYPVHISETDHLASRVLSAGKDLSSDHPGFHDRDYRKRRNAVAESIRDYRIGDPIPRCAYTDSERQTWSTIYDRQMPQLRRHACQPYLTCLDTFAREAGFQRNNIPQLDDVSNVLLRSTGFQLRPVEGLLTPRDFMAGLAFRVFFSTQYIRHHKDPFYTPEPDVVHELIGHAPLFADPTFADFSQTLGLASIGASEADIQRLARCYWYTVEFGLCRQGKERKAYGAGILSSVAELENAMQLDPPPSKARAMPAFRVFDAAEAAQVPYPITTVQPVYWVTESFQDALEQMKRLVASFHRAFEVRYRKRTQMLVSDRWDLISDTFAEYETKQKNLLLQASPTRARVP